MAQTRFVILRHEGIESPHFDLLFETAPGSMLAAWRSDAWPIAAPTTLTRLPDHRRHYLTYEGPVSGNRGHVQRIDTGSCQIEFLADQWLIRFADGQTLRLEQAGHQWTAAPA